MSFLADATLVRYLDGDTLEVLWTEGPHDGLTEIVRDDVYDAPSLVGPNRILGKAIVKEATASFAAPGDTLRILARGHDLAGRVVGTITAQGTGLPLWFWAILAGVPNNPSATVEGPINAIYWNPRYAAPSHWNPLLWIDDL